MGTWMPGAVSALRSLSALGEVTIYSCRVNPYEVGHDGEPGYLRPVGAVQESINAIRAMLDAEGLHTVRIHTTLGKPPGDEYIDNKARRYLGRPRSWERLTDLLVGLYE